MKIQAVVLLFHTFSHPTILGTLSDISFMYILVYVCTANIDIFANRNVAWSEGNIANSGAGVRIVSRLCDEAPGVIPRW